MKDSKKGPGTKNPGKIKLEYNQRLASLASEYLNDY